MALGARIDPSQATISLPIAHDDRIWFPVLPYDGRWLVASDYNPRLRSDNELGREFLFWDPATGQATHAWNGESGKQELVYGPAGNWVVVVRLGLSLPFPDWEMTLRNLVTGEVRPIAEDDPQVVKTPGLEPKLPLGFAPQPSLSNGHIVWHAIEIMDDGSPRDRVWLYDLASGERTLLYEVQDPSTEELYSPTAGGNRVAWVRHPSPDAPYEIDVRDLVTGEQRTVTDVAGPFSAALSGDGKYLAWDEGFTAKWALNLETGERVEYSTYVGSGAIISGHYISWGVQGKTGAKGGFYDLETKTLRTIDVAPYVAMNLAKVIGGKWFVWQYLPIENPSEGVYYFMPVDGN